MWSHDLLFYASQYETPGQELPSLYSIGHNAIRQHQRHKIGWTAYPMEELLQRAWPRLNDAKSQFWRKGLLGLEIYGCVFFPPSLLYYSIGGCLYFVAKSLRRNLPKGASHVTCAPKNGPHFRFANAQSILFYVSGL